MLYLRHSHPAVVNAKSAKLILREAMMRAQRERYSAKSADRAKLAKAMDRLDRAADYLSAQLRDTPDAWVELGPECYVPEVAR